MFFSYSTVRNTIISGFVENDTGWRGQHVACAE